MKSMKYLTWLLILPLFAGIILTGCKDDDEDEPTPINYTALDASIIEAQDLHDNATEGTNIGDYEAGSKAELQTAIDLATQVRNNPDVTQSQVDAADVALQAAIDTFESKKIEQIAPENLVANWLFNGDATDATGNGHDGTIEDGYVLNGGGSIAPAEDRLGNAGYAYMFEGGGNIVVGQDPALNPPEMTIVTWIKLSETWAHSYFISNDIWNCWKFQVQDANKPFFTCQIRKDDGSFAHINQDSGDQTLDPLNDVWQHIAVTYKSGEMVFYIDGVAVKTWTPPDCPTGTKVDPNPAVDICIGQGLPSDVYSDVPGDPYEWKEWIGYLKGYLDDMKIYNIVLSETQINSIYTFEKDNVNE